MKKQILLLVFFAVSFFTKANNIQVSNISVVPANNTIKFTVSWDNSWRSGVLNNWDAAWVFLKFFSPTTQTWLHLFMTGTGNVIPSGFTASFAPIGPGLNSGVFLHRSAPGSGTSTLADVEIGIPASQATGVYDIKVFAIEMVYIPQSEFFIGDGSIFTSNRYTTNSTSANPGMVQSGSVAAYDPLIPGTLSSLPASFPKGYNAFYCMKYELTQGAYRDFLNSLTYTQQTTRTANPPNSPTGTTALNTGFRQFLEVRAQGAASTIPAVYGCDADGDNIYNETTDGEWAVCSYLNWPDHAAYLAWACLRPLTELEYEKTCRGIQIPVGAEYAWGNSNIAITAYSFSTLGQASESVTNAAASPTGNAVYFGTVSGNVLLRNGIFATATSNRISSGAGFYGVMELTGSVLERVVATHNGSGFTGSHGDGNLNAQGNAQVVFSWPGFNGATISVDGGINATGLILRGGNLSNTVTSNALYVSSRGNIVADANTVRSQIYGVRGCRTAP